MLFVPVGTVKVYGGLDVFQIAFATDRGREGPKDLSSESIDMTSHRSEVQGLSRDLCTNIVSIMHRERSGSRLLFDADQWARFSRPATKGRIHHDRPLFGSRRSPVPVIRGSRCVEGLGFAHIVEGG